MGKIDFVQFQSADVLADAAAREWINTLPSTGPQLVGLLVAIAKKVFDAITTIARAHNLSLAQIHFLGGRAMRSPITREPISLCVAMLHP